METNKNRAEIEVDAIAFPTGGKNLRVWRDPAGLNALSVIAIELRREGFRVSDPKPAIGFEAGLVCKLASDCKLDILLGVRKRTSDTLEFVLVSWWGRYWGPIAISGGQPSRRCLDEWEKLVGTLDRIVKESLNCRRIRWYSSSEAEERLAVLERGECDSEY